MNMEYKLSKESREAIKALNRMLKYSNKLDDEDPQKLYEQIINDKKLRKKDRDFLLNCLKSRGFRYETEYNFSVASDGIIINERKLG
jgi:hypothetical protein